MIQTFILKAVKKNEDGYNIMTKGFIQEEYIIMITAYVDNNLPMG